MPAKGDGAWLSNRLRYINDQAKFREQERQHEQLVFGETSIMLQQESIGSTYTQNAASHKTFVSSLRGATVSPIADGASFAAKAPSVAYKQTASSIARQMPEPVRTVDAARLGKAPGVAYKKTYSSQVRDIITQEENDGGRQAVEGRRGMYMGVTTSPAVSAGPVLGRRSRHHDDDDDNNGGGKMTWREIQALQQEREQKREQQRLAVQHQKLAAARVAAQQTPREPYTYTDTRDTSPRKQWREFQEELRVKEDARALMRSRNKQRSQEREYEREMMKSTSTQLRVYPASPDQWTEEPVYHNTHGSSSSSSSGGGGPKSPPKSRYALQRFASPTLSSAAQATVSPGSASKSRKKLSGSRNGVGGSGRKKSGKSLSNKSDGSEGARSKKKKSKPTIVSSTTRTRRRSDGTVLVRARDGGGASSATKSKSKKKTAVKSSSASTRTSTTPGSQRKSRKKVATKASGKKSAAAAAASTASAERRDREAAAREVADLEEQRRFDDENCGYHIKFDEYDDDVPIDISDIDVVFDDADAEQLRREHEEQRKKCMAAEKELRDVLVPARFVLSPDGDHAEEMSILEQATKDAIKSKRDEQDGKKQRQLKRLQKQNQARNLTDDERASITTAVAQAERNLARQEVLVRQRKDRTRRIVDMSAERLRKRKAAVTATRRRAVHLSSAATDEQRHEERFRYMLMNQFRIISSVVSGTADVEREHERARARLTRLQAAAKADVATKGSDSEQQQSTNFVQLCAYDPHRLLRRCAARLDRCLDVKEWVEREQTLADEHLARVESTQHQSFGSGLYARELEHAQSLQSLASLHTDLWIVEFQQCQLNQEKAEAGVQSHMIELQQSLNHHIQSLYNTQNREERQKLHVRILSDRVANDEAMQDEMMLSYKHMQTLREEWAERLQLAEQTVAAHKDYCAKHHSDRSNDIERVGHTPEMMRWRSLVRQAQAMAGLCAKEAKLLQRDIDALARKGADVREGFERVQQELVDAQAALARTVASRETRQQEQIAQLQQQMSSEYGTRLSEIWEQRSIPVKFLMSGGHVEMPNREALTTECAAALATTTAALAAERAKLVDDIKRERRHVEKSSQAVDDGNDAAATTVLLDQQLKLLQTQRQCASAHQTLIDGAHALHRLGRVPDATTDVAIAIADATSSSPSTSSTAKQSRAARAAQYPKLADKQRRLELATAELDRQHGAKDALEREMDALGQAAEAAVVLLMEAEEAKNAAAAAADGGADQDAVEAATSAWHTAKTKNNDVSVQVLQLQSRVARLKKAFIAADGEVREAARDLRRFRRAQNGGNRDVGGGSEADEISDNDDDDDADQAAAAQKGSDDDDDDDEEDEMAVFGRCVDALRPLMNAAATTHAKLLASLSTQRSELASSLAIAAANSVDESLDGSELNDSALGGDVDDDGDGGTSSRSGNSSGMPTPRIGKSRAVNASEHVAALRRQREQTAAAKHAAQQEEQRARQRTVLTAAEHGCAAHRVHDDGTVSAVTLRLMRATGGDGTEGVDDDVTTQAWSMSAGDDAVFVLRECQLTNGAVGAGHVALRAATAKSAAARGFCGCASKPTPPPLPAFVDDDCFALTTDDGTETTTMHFVVVKPQQAAEWRAALAVLTARGVGGL